MIRLARRLPVAAFPVPFLAGIALAAAGATRFLFEDFVSRRFLGSIFWELHLPRHVWPPSAARWLGVAAFGLGVLLLVVAQRRGRASDWRVYPLTFLWSWVLVTFGFVVATGASLRGDAGAGGALLYIQFDPTILGERPLRLATGLVIAAVGILGLALGTVGRGSPRHASVPPASPSPSLPLPAPSRSRAIPVAPPVVLGNRVR